MVGRATLTIVMSMMFMNMADTNTVPTTIFWFMRNAGTRLILTVEACWSRRPGRTRRLNSVPDHRRSALRFGPGLLLWVGLERVRWHRSMEGGRRSSDA